jgi:hypothetical protein
MNKNVFFPIILVSFFLPTLINPLRHDVADIPKQMWSYQCIDTMKYSRDTARAWENKEDELYQEINLQIKTIKDMGANCISLGTPYAPEFVPFMDKWVNAAHANDLHVWFRGNIPEWEKWFDYPKISNINDHHQKIYDFVTGNTELFKDDDIFTPAPEAENGGPGDPRQTGKRKEFNDFLIKSYANCEKAFSQIGKKVKCGFFSSNFDVANQVLQQTTLPKIGNVVTIDHYVSDYTRYRSDIKLLNMKYGAQVAIGEFGAPIPDLNGDMTEEQQADFTMNVMNIFYENREIIPAINYWTLKGGSTRLLNDDGTPRQVTEILSSFFMPGAVRIKVTDDLEDWLANVNIKSKDGFINGKTNYRGEFFTSVPAKTYEVTISGENIQDKTLEISVPRQELQEASVVVEIKSQNWLYKLRKFFQKIFAARPTAKFTTSTS